MVRSTLEFVDDSLIQRLPYLDYAAPGNSREKFTIKTPWERLMPNKYLKRNSFQEQLDSAALEEFVKHHSQGKSPYQSLTPTEQRSNERLFGVLFIAAAVIVLGLGLVGSLMFTLVFGPLGVLINLFDLAIGGLFLYLGIAMLVKAQRRDMLADWEGLYRFHNFVQNNQLEHHPQGSGRELAGSLFDSGSAAEEQSFSHVLSGQGRFGHYFEFGQYSYSTRVYNTRAHKNRTIAHHYDYMGIYMGIDYAHSLLVPEEGNMRLLVPSEFRRPLAYGEESFQLYSKASAENSEKSFDWELLTTMQSEFPTVAMELVDGWLLFFRSETFLPASHAPETAEHFAKLLDFAERSLFPQIIPLELNQFGNRQGRMPVKLEPKRLA